MANEEHLARLQQGVAAWINGGQQILTLSLTSPRRPSPGLPSTGRPSAGRTSPGRTSPGRTSRRLVAFPQQFWNI
jgi:hypothetical protein